MFHMFPKLSVDKILSSLKHEHNNFNKNVFITRGTALHMPRNLDNQIEIEQHFLSINYNVINPEVIDIETLIQQIKNAEYKLTILPLHSFGGKTYKQKKNKRKIQKQSKRNRKLH